MEFQGKNIIIISQQDWGKMFVSKHHYATELAKKGNVVYFFNSPAKDDSLKPGDIVVEPTEIAGLYVVKHRFSFSYNLKFRFKWLFGILVKKHIQRILSQIKPIDIVWSFDLSNTLPLGAFPDSAYKIYMLADMPGKESVIAAKDADIILSTNFSNEFLEKTFAQYSIPKRFVNHGISEKFIRFDPVQSGGSGKNLKVGMAGNFLRPDIDWPTLSDIINSNPDVVFNLWGAIDPQHANLGWNAGEHLAYVEKMKHCPNVKLHGPVHSDTLAAHYAEMDLFLICYDIDKDQSAGTNYHKILEYMATGKVIVANNTSAYHNMPELLTMPEERNNSKLPALFTAVIKNFEEYNSDAKQQKRIAYARQHTYSGNIGRIQSIINNTSAE